MAATMASTMPTAFGNSRERKGSDCNRQDNRFHVPLSRGDVECAALLRDHTLANLQNTIQCSRPGPLLDGWTWARRQEPASQAEAITLADRNDD